MCGDRVWREREGEGERECVERERGEREREREVGLEPAHPTPLLLPAESRVLHFLGAMQRTRK